MEGVVAVVVLLSSMVLEWPNGRGGSWKDNPWGGCLKLQPPGSGEEGPWQKEVVNGRSGYGRSEGWKEVTSSWAAGGACWEEEGRDKGDVDGGLLLLTNLRVSLPGW